MSELTKSASTIKRRQLSLREKLLALITPATSEVVRRDEAGVIKAEVVPDDSISISGHLLLAFVYIGLSIAYFIFATVTFALRPEQEFFTQVPAIGTPSVQLQVEVFCTNPPNCGDIYISQNYSAVPPCASLPSFVRTVPANSSGRNNAANVVLDLDLCATPDFTFTVETENEIRAPGLVIEFTQVNPGVNFTDILDSAPELAASGIVHVKSHPLTHDSRRLARSTGDFVGSKASLPGVTLDKIVTLDNVQVKTLVIGQTIRRRDGSDFAHDVIPLETIYEGKRPTHRATLMVRSESFLNVFNRERSGTYMEVLANVGGGVSLIGLGMAALAPIVGCLLPGKKDPTVI